MADFLDCEPTVTFPVLPKFIIAGRQRLKIERAPVGKPFGGLLTMDSLDASEMPSKQFDNLQRDLIIDKVISVLEMTAEVHDTLEKLFADRVFMAAGLSAQTLKEVQALAVLISVQGSTLGQMEGAWSHADVSDAIDMVSDKSNSVAQSLMMLPAGQKVHTSCKAKRDMIKASDNKLGFTVECAQDADEAMRFDDPCDVEASSGVVSVAVKKLNASWSMLDKNDFSRNSEKLRTTMTGFATRVADYRSAFILWAYDTVAKVEVENPTWKNESVANVPM